MLTGMTMGMDIRHGCFEVSVWLCQRSGKTITTKWRREIYRDMFHILEMYPLIFPTSGSFYCLIRSKCSLCFTPSAPQALKYNAINWQRVFSVTFALPDCCWLLLTIFKSQTIATVTYTYIWLCHSLHMSGDLPATFPAHLTRWKLAHTKEGRDRGKQMLDLR